MDIANLIHMANRIADFHASWPDHQAAVDATAEHIRKFWAPRMRSAILEALGQAHTPALHPLALEALQQHRDDLMPAPH